LLQATEQRTPCFKLGLKLHNMRALKWMLQSGFSGWYCRVLEAGTLTAGDPIHLEM
jgi:MOSC domain-containing protein YiiM